MTIPEPRPFFKKHSSGLVKFIILDVILVTVISLFISALWGDSIYDWVHKSWLKEVPYTEVFLTSGIKFDNPEELNLTEFKAQFYADKGPLLKEFTEGHGDPYQTRKLTVPPDLQLSIHLLLSSIDTRFDIINNQSYCEILQPFRHFKKVRPPRSNFNSILLTKCDNCVINTLIVNNTGNASASDLRIDVCSKQGVISASEGSGIISHIGESCLKIRKDKLYIGDSQVWLFTTKYPDNQKPFKDTPASELFDIRITTEEEKDLPLDERVWRSLSAFISNCSATVREGSSFTIFEP